MTLQRMRKCFMDQQDILLSEQKVFVKMYVEYCILCIWEAIYLLEHKHMYLRFTEESDNRSNSTTVHHSCPTRLLWLRLGK